MIRSTLRHACCGFLFICLGAWAQAADQPVLEIDKDDLSPVGGLAWVAAEVTLPTLGPEIPLVDPQKKGPAASLLRRLFAQGRSSGHHGILYDNRDRNHSTLSAALFPRLTRIRYGSDLRAEKLDYGLAGRILFPTVVIGNSSTAITRGPHARSQARLAMTSAGGPARAYLTYANNHLYVYPEHRDYDAVDRFPAYWPYMIVSKGSSGSDQPFLEATAMALAAIRPETMAFLTEHRLVAPTLQMILRRTQAGIYTDESYLSPRAHPTVFNKNGLARERVVSLAAALAPEDIPALVRLRVDAEDFRHEADLAGYSERLFDTPSAIARIWRDHAYQRTVTLSAADTVDPNGHELDFRWVLLRGDPAMVDILPTGEKGQHASLRIRWHEPAPSPGRPMESRVDIAVFADNGRHISAPGIFSVQMPRHHRRTYEPAAEAALPRLREIDYAPGEDLDFDPRIHWRADWRDQFEWTATGELKTVRRHFTDGRVDLIDLADTARAMQTGYRLVEKGGVPRLVHGAVD